MTSSSNASNASPASVAPETATFSLWPLPDLSAASSDPFETRLATPESEAFERGYSEGVKAASLDIEREKLTLLDTVIDALATGAAERDEERRVVEENVYALAVAVARQILHAAIEEDDGVIRGLVLRAVERAGPTGTLEITMHPDDSALVKGELEFHNENGVSRNVNWTDDPSAPRGSCIVECEQRLVKGGIDSALSNLFQRLSRD